MRRLLVVVSVTVFADTMLFSAIVPLIPHFTDDFDLSKLEAGILVAAYGAGAVVAGIPSGLLAARVGAKRTAVAGLVVIAVATLVFSVSTSALLLEVARFTQGVGSAVTWCGALAWLTLATPSERRGRALGLVFSIAVLGFIVGPAIGALAELTSIRGTFVVIGAGTLLVAVFASTFPAGRADAGSHDSLRRTMRNRPFFAAVWLVTVPSLFLGAVDLLVPLSLDSSDWGTIAIATTFVVGAFSEVLLAPVIGDFSDRRGRLVPVRAGLVLLVGVAVLFVAIDAPFVVAALVTAASIAASLIYSPSVALISDRAEEAEIPQALAFGFMNTAWAAGVMLGPALGGAMADAWGDAVPYACCGVLAFGTLMILRGARSTPTVASAAE